MEFYNHEALSIIYFFRNRAANIIYIDDKIYHKLIGRTIDALINFPFRSNSYSNGDFLNFYYLKLAEFFSDRDIKEIIHLIDEFCITRDEGMDTYLQTIGKKFILFLQRNVVENELMHMLKVISFFHYVFAVMFSKFPNDTKERNFLLSMIEPFKYVFGKLRFMELQLWNINLCCKEKCKYKMNWKEKLYFKSNFGRSSRFILTRYVYFFL